jgi:RNA polymerase primary sigma factor
MALPHRKIFINPVDSDSLKSYLKDIYNIPLITVEEEIVLANKIKKGDDTARELLIKSNLRLVIKIACEYVNYGLPLIDLIAEGNVGLMKAADRFNPIHKCKFSTYAAWWIKQAIKRALANQSKTIRLPVHLMEKLNRIRAAAAAFDTEFRREPTDEELGKEVGLQTYKVTTAKQAAIPPISLDAPDLWTAGNRMHEIIPDDSAETPFASLANEDLRQTIKDLLHILDSREKAILMYRFGLNGSVPLTLECVGKKLGITRERVRQLQNLSLQKLKDALAEKETYAN